MKERVIKTKEIYDGVKEECGINASMELLKQEFNVWVCDEANKHFNYYYRKDKAGEGKPKK